MPIDFTPSRRLLTAYLKLRARLRGENPESNQIKSETIEAVNDNGTYVVKGAMIPASGNIKLSSGQRVDVVYKNARPRVIIGHNARRAQFNIEIPGGGNPVVEELFIATRPDDNVIDLWFRNFDQCVPLHLDKFGVTPIFDTGQSQPRWGPSNEYFYLRSQFTKVWVFKFKRKPFTPFKGGQKADQELEFVHFYDTTTISSPVVATLNAAGQTGGAIVLTPSNLSETHIGPSPTVLGELGVVDIALDTNGDLIFSYLVSASVTGAKTVDGPTVQPCGQTEPATASALVSIGGAWPVTVNLTRGTKILDGFSTGVPGALVSPLQGSSFSYNSLNLLALSGTWTFLDQVIDTDPVSPCFNQVIGVAYCFDFSIGNPTLHTLIPLLVQGVTPDFSNVVNGFVAYLRSVGSNPPEGRFFYGANPPST